MKNSESLRETSSIIKGEKLSRSLGNDYKIESNWVDGRPEGRGNLTIVSKTYEVFFKNGVISRIYTQEPILTIYFPYKFIRKGSIYEEVNNDSSDSYYSVLRFPKRISFFEKVINRKLNNISELQRVEGVYLGETVNGRIAHGFGILMNENYVFSGNFENNKIEGRGYFESDQFIFKGNFIGLFVYGQAKKKYKHTGFVFKGNFDCDEKHGKFDVFVENFKIEANFESEEIKGNVRLFRNGNFIAEFFTYSKFLIPVLNEIENSDVLDFYNISIMAKAKNDSIFDSPEHIERIRLDLENYQKYHKRILSIMRKNKLKLGVYNWNNYETELYQKNKIRNKIETNIKVNEAHTIKRIFYRKNEFYIGMIREQKPNGLGIYVKDGNVIFRGYWKDQKFHGKGRLSLNNYLIQGIWENGKLIKIFHLNKLDN